MKTFIAIVIVGTLFYSGTLKTTVVTLDTRPIATTPCYVKAFSHRKNTHESSKQALARCDREYESARKNK